MTTKIQKNTEFIVKYLLEEIGFLSNPDAFILGAYEEIKSYGDEGALDFSALQYFDYDAIINGQFDYYLGVGLSNDQKELLKSYLPSQEALQIAACSCNRRIVEIVFNLKIKNVKQTASYLLSIEIKFPSFDRKKFTYNGEFLEKISEQEIGELLNWKSLKS
jgi:hypothetical protein